MMREVPLGLCILLLLVSGPLLIVVPYLFLDIGAPIFVSIPFLIIAITGAATFGVRRNPLSFVTLSVLSTATVFFIYRLTVPDSMSSLFGVLFSLMLAMLPIALMFRFFFSPSSRPYGSDFWKGCSSFSACRAANILKANEGTVDVPLRHNDYRNPDHSNKDSRVETPLMVAAKYNTNPSVIYELIGAGGDPLHVSYESTEDRQGKTAYDMAVEGENKTAIAILESYNDERISLDKKETK